jgi:MFS family permease
MIKLTEKSTIILLCFINLLNYLDRGIIPGAPDTFQNFIHETLGVPVTDQALYLGILASAFIASYSVFSIIFGYLSISYKPFNMIAMGMIIWVIAVFICGLAQQANSYYLLLIGRILSGVGEASFQCVTAPFIDDYAPANKKSLWLGIFLSSISVGTAVGYIYGSFFASSGLGWSFSFYLEGVLMIGLILIAYFCVPDHLNKIPTSKAATTRVEKEIDSMAEGLLVERYSQRLSQVEEDEENKQSFFKELVNIFKNPTFVLISWGYAAFTFSIFALSVFCPVLLIGLGLFEEESSASFVFGALAAVTGTIGTPIGGWFIDRAGHKAPKGTLERAYVSLKQVFWIMVVGFAFAMASYVALPSKMGFLGLMALAFLFLFAVAPGVVVTIMELFPSSRRAFAISANMITIHALGDVPSPIILGALKDSWAPKCGTVEIDGKPTLNPECIDDREGLMHVILFAFLWFGWVVLFWGIACRVLSRKVKMSNKDLPILQ